MFHIEDTVVSREVADVYFCCDLEACGGACCVEGDAGAPVLEVEKDPILQALPLVEHLLPQTNREYMAEHGLLYYDDDDELVTQIIRGRECVFTCREEDGSCRCAFEKGYTEGVNPLFYKPISCHLYPIRLTKYRDFIAVNYHKWQICEPALRKGRKLGIRLYRFLKNPLVRAFGEEWYDKLEKEVEIYISQEQERS